MKKVKKRKFGLLGKNISYSFSKKYFTDKFENLGLDSHSYVNFDTDSIETFPTILSETKNLKGMNVTIPYKEAIIPFLGKLSKNAAAIGAVNTIRITKKGATKGYNTDFYGFKRALKPMLKKHHQKALILGTGGASKAVAYALQKLKIEYDFVSRNASECEYSYTELNDTVFNDYQIIINTTPLGTFPNIQECPELDYSLFTNKHIAFDLVYNPEETEFLKRARSQGAKVKNGYDMLVFQAEKAWDIWTEKQK